MPSDQFPVSVLQNGVKMTVEPPQGLRANLLLSYSTVDDQELSACAKPEAFKTLFFGFCFFHAIVQDRRKFGPIGWNIPYEFTNEDLQVTLKQLRLFLNQEGAVPYKVLNILGADVNYGGRVTDDKDIRLIRATLENYITPEVFTENYKFSSSGKYYAITAGHKENYLQYIESLDLNPEPEAFGLHDNAEISTNQADTRKLLGTILLMQPRSAAGVGKSREQIICNIAQDLELHLPDDFQVEEVNEKYPTRYEESMNTVLSQEVTKYQRLLSRMRSTLSDVQRALLGRIVMSEELEALASALFDNQVPCSWAEVGFLSLKPLGAWVQDLECRVKFLADWVECGAPSCFWISGFFFPQAFITGTLQNYARKQTIPIDWLSFEFRVMDHITLQEIKEKPSEGCYVHGLWLEGARWDKDTHALGWSNPKELYIEMPVIHLVPVQNRKTPHTGLYNCPVYKVLTRQGALSTTGHSTNFVLFIELPSEAAQEKWVKAGVALFLALRT